MEKPMLKLMDLLTEGVHDKGIFKAVFVAGGPGSGKSYIAKQLFIPAPANCKRSIYPSTKIMLLLSLICWMLWLIPYNT